MSRLYTVCRRIAGTFKIVFILCHNINGIVSSLAAHYLSGYGRRNHYHGTRHRCTAGKRIHIFQHLFAVAAERAHHIGNSDNLKAHGYVVIIKGNKFADNIFLAEKLHGTC